MHVLSL